MRTRPLLLPLLAAAALGLTACDPGEPGVDLMADVVVTVPGAPPAGDLYRPTSVTVAADGTRTVLLGGPEAAGVAAVSADGTVLGALGVPGVTDLFAVVPTPAGAVAVGWADGPEGAGGSVVLVPVDVAAGTTGAAVPVLTPVPAGHVEAGLSSATVLPDGRVVLALDRVGDTVPLLALVEPVTATVVAQAELDLGDTVAGAGVVDVVDVAASPDGTRIAVGVLAHSRDWGGGGFRAVLATVDAGLRPDGPALDLTAGSSGQVEAVAVDAGGTAYAVAALGSDLSSQLLAAAPGATRVEVLGDAEEDLLGGQAADLVVADGAAWVLHAVPGDGDDASLTRVDLADGTASAPRGLCDGQAGALAVEPDGDVVAVSECGFEARLFVLAPR
ncbi:hypothetical protein [Blastococcus sp. SYSU D00813]